MKPSPLTRHVSNDHPRTPAPLLQQLERLREKQAELTKIQREAKAVAQAILIIQRQIAAITDEVANLIAFQNR